MPVNPKPTVRECSASLIRRESAAIVFDRQDYILDPLLHPDAYLCRLRVLQDVTQRFLNDTVEI